LSLPTAEGRHYRGPVFPLTQMNLKTYTHATGAALAALSNIQLGKIYRCSTTGNGFIAGNFYMRNATNNGWITVYGLGGFQEILTDSLQGGVYFEALYPRKVQFGQNTATGGTITDDNTDGGIVVDTQATDTGRAMINLERGTWSLDFARPTTIKIKMEFIDAEMCLARMGCGYKGYNTTTMDASRHFGIEIDNANLSDTFWQLTSGDGTTITKVITSSMPVGPSNTYRYILEYIPLQGIKLYQNGFLVGTKTTNLPNNGSPVSGAYNFLAMVRTMHADGKELRVRSLIITSGNADLY
jgi:hypothetical protein